MKVNINGHDHQVEIEAEGTLEDGVAGAKELWHDTVQPPRPPGPASAGASSQVTYQPTRFRYRTGLLDTPLPVRAGGNTP